MVKVKVNLPRTGHKGPEWEQMYLYYIFYFIKLSKNICS
jgi:hypothetical protein